MSTKARILVADDDPEMLATVAEAVDEVFGAEVVRAATGAELVLQLATQGPFDLVITDISMPWMNGLQAMRSLKYAGVTGPIIFMTGLADEKLPERVTALGTDAVLLRKPFSLAQLEETIDGLLAGTRTER